MALEREEFMSGIASLKELLNQRCDGIERRVTDGFQRTNGRLDRAEDNISELEGDVKVLKDRGVRDNTARASGISGLVASVSGLLWQWFKA